MFNRIGTFFLLGAGALLMAAGAQAGPIPSSGSTASMLKAAVNGNWRSAKARARDKYRHPIKTLEFFGIKPDMTVIELTPGGGWYTAILAPFLYAHGQLIEPTVPAGASKFAVKMAKRYDAKLKADPAVYGHIKRGLPFAPFTAHSKHLKLGPNDSADMVVTFRNMHDYHNAGNLQGVLEAAYNVLKPGGVLGITDNRAMPNAKASVVDHTLHRNVEGYMIEAGLKAGFRLAGVSQINANPRDPLTIRVFHLFPSFAHDSPSQLKKMKAIGGPDAMTLKFVKP
ncbi:MAG: class I SAM-dependent methyltransferase [Gammaproteobacteria bacterium]